MENQQIISGYAKLNKAYNDSFDALQELMENGFDDPDVIQRYNYGMNVLDEALSILKDKHVDPAMQANKAPVLKVVNPAAQADEAESEESEEPAEDEKKSKGGLGFRIFGGKK